VYYIGNDKQKVGFMIDLNSKVNLNNNTKMPLLGFGTWLVDDGDIAYRAVKYALKVGYRHIDTARFYGNEESVGRAIRDSGVKREEIWVTTKLRPNDIFNVEAAFQASLDRLNIGYIDLYLMHFPVPGFVKQSWKKLEKIYTESGKVKAIGVSNHSIGQIKAILSVATVKPTVNQIKCSPFNYNPTMHDFCRKNDIVMEAYSPLTHGNDLNNSKLATIATKYDKTSAQILLRWCVQKGIPTIPKSVHENRILENMNIFDFELSDQDIVKLDNFRN
jgi:diketogulonate reductase-like aldo/keto reductase